MLRLLAALLALVFIGVRPALASDRFTFEARDVELADAIRMLSSHANYNIVADGSIRTQRISIALRDVTCEEALQTLAAAYGLQLHRGPRFVLVGDAGAMNRRYPDEAVGGGTQTRVFGLRYAKPDDLAASLKSALPDGTVIVPDKRTGTLVVSGGAGVLLRTRSLIAALDVPSLGGGGNTLTRTLPLRYVRATEAIKALHGAVPEAAVLADDRQNAVIVTGNGEVQDAVRSLITGLDAPGRQVMFEVRVADVEPINENDNIGVLFGGATFGAGALGQVPYTLARGTPIINAQIDLLVQRGHASILAQPRIATLNNREASLLVGEQYPVVTVNQQTGFPSVQTIDIGVRLRLTPTIGDDGSITADLHPEYSQIVGFNAAFPIVANRKVDATLRVRDGETIVLGGLFQDVDAQTVTKFPFLGDLPGLGVFFRNRERTHRRDEVVFFITPHILAAPGV